MLYMTQYFPYGVKLSQGDKSFQELIPHDHQSHSD